MNRATKAGLIHFQACPFQLRASFFHSTPVLERKRRTHWDSGGGASRGVSRRSNHFSRRYRKLQSKEEMLRNVSSYAEHLFKSWQFDHDEYDSCADRSRNSWFRQDFQGNGFRRAKSSNKRTHFWTRRSFQFFEDDDDIDVETIFSSAFGSDNRYFFYTFRNGDPEWQKSSFHSNDFRYYWNKRNSYEEEYESSHSDSSISDTRSDRLALGLSVSGPLSIEDVKNAYRACALKWHPDRHQSSSKELAEEKFKVCSAAYQSLCDKFALGQ